MHNDRLFTVESSGHLVEIDVDAGEVRQRHPVPNSSFLNDVTVDPDGNVYISNTSRRPGARDVFRFRDGQFETFKDGYDLHRANGLFVYDHRLIVGNTGDGMLKAVALDDGRVDEIACLGFGVLDGIRVNNAGNYLVSHWQGQVFRITPVGEVVEILDIMSEGLNVADFEFIKKKNLLVIPTFLGNKVVAYRMTE
jgi:sugar lactone lactonase YvrE